MNDSSLEKLKSKIRKLEVLTDYSQIKLSMAKENLQNNPHCYDEKYEVQAIQNNLDSQLNELETLHGYLDLHYESESTSVI